MFKKAIALLICLMLPAGAVADWEVVGNATVVVQESSHLNGRAKPVNGPIEMKLYLGDKVEIVSYGRDGWVEIIGGETGTVWVKDAFLTDEWYTLENPEVYRISSNGRVRVRTIPDGEASGWAKNGDMVTVSAIAVKNGVTWAKIEDGYVMERFLTEVEGK